MTDDLGPQRGRGGTLPGIPQSLRSEHEQLIDRVTEFPIATEIPNRKSYEIVERLGEGGMGKIYKAFDAGMDRYVALKFLKLDVPDSERRRFRREAVLAANFAHPNLARVLDVGKTPHGVEWLAMEYLSGRDLGQIVDRRRRVAFQLVIDIFRQVLDALDYVHTRSIVHCDIKPDNIFVTRDSYDRRLVIVKLIDFGIARKLDEPLELHRQITGDPRYMPPEQAVLNARLDHRADIYALGMTLYEVLTGVHPFQDVFDAPASVLLDAQMRRVPPPPSAMVEADWPPNLRWAVDELYARCCAKRPEDRFSDARAMQAAVLGLLDVE